MERLVFASKPFFQVCVSHSQAQGIQFSCLHVRFFISGRTVIWSCLSPSMLLLMTNPISINSLPRSGWILSLCPFLTFAPPILFIQENLPYSLPRDGQTSHYFLVSSMDILLLKKVQVCTVVSFRNANQKYIIFGDMVLNGSQERSQEMV